MSVFVLGLGGVLFWTGWWLRIPAKPGRLADVGYQAGSYVRKRFLKSRIRRLTEVAVHAQRKRMCERELTECLSYIRHVIAMGRDCRMSRDLLLEELAEVSDSLQGVFRDMAHRLRISEAGLAEEVFYRTFEEDYARDVAKLFIEWEHIAPTELLSTVEAYRDLLREKHKTAQKKRDEWVSDLVYFPVVANAMIVLLNFIYIAYFIQQRELLTGIY